MAQALTSKYIVAATLSLRLEDKLLGVLSALGDKLVDVFLSREPKIGCKDRLTGECSSQTTGHFTVRLEAGQNSWVGEGGLNKLHVGQQVVDGGAFHCEGPLQP